MLALCSIKYCRADPSKLPKRDLSKGDLSKGVLSKGVLSKGCVRQCVVDSNVRGVALKPAK